MKDLEDCSVCSLVLAGTGLNWNLNYLLFLDSVNRSSFLLKSWQLLCLSPGKRMQSGPPHVATVVAHQDHLLDMGKQRTESPQSAVNSAKNCLSIWQTLCWELAWKSISPLLRNLSPLPFLPSFLLPSFLLPSSLPLPSLLCFLGLLICWWSNKTKYFHSLDYRRHLSFCTAKFFEYFFTRKM